MNDVINDIAFLAGCNKHRYGNPFHPDLDGWIINQEALDKFAELIVRECTELTLDYIDDNYYRGWIDYRDAIRNHFGVEK